MNENQREIIFDAICDAKNESTKNVVYDILNDLEIQLGLIPIEE